jgi:predicted kinase
MMKKSLVIVCGLPGSGKSYFARALAERIGAKHLNSDEIRQHLFEDRSYSTREKIAVYRQMADLAFEYLEKDKRVVVDATF